MGARILNAFDIIRRIDELMAHRRPVALSLPPDPAPQPGPGTELKKLLRRFGVVSSPDCRCEAMAARMNALGPDGSAEIIDEIIATMREEATRRGLPWIEAAARLLVKRAIANARKSA